jgi:hypothetical protein
MVQAFRPFNTLAIVMNVHYPLIPISAFVNKKNKIIYGNFENRAKGR